MLKQEHGKILWKHTTENDVVNKKSYCHNNNNNNGLLTVYPPSGSSPVKNYNIKNEKL